MAEHSPVGPLFLPHAHNYLEPDSPLYGRTLVNVGREGFVVIGEDLSKTGFLEEALADFGDRVPPCASSSALVTQFRIRFHSNTVEATE